MLVSSISKLSYIWNFKMIKQFYYFSNRDIKIRSQYMNTVTIMLTLTDADVGARPSAGQLALSPNPEF